MILNRRQPSASNVRVGKWASKWWRSQPLGIFQFSLKIFKLLNSRSRLFMQWNTASRKFQFQTNQISNFAKCNKPSRFKINQWRAKLVSRINTMNYFGPINGLQRVQSLKFHCRSLWLHVTIRYDYYFFHYQSNCRTWFQSLINDWGVAGKVEGFCCCTS